MTTTGTQKTEATFDATTEGIRVSVKSQYLADQSSPRERRYVFSYTVTIANGGDVPVQLVSRHWVITDARNHVEEVRGPGVVGKQPRLRPGERFEYTSGCVLTTPSGEMHGEYQMVRADGTEFDAKIPAFVLAFPHSLN
ncbi:MAG TPA: Co2+/Mg2+ efflux protein ApaG [Polyangiaceae bacterium]